MSTNTFARDAVLSELERQGLVVVQTGRDFIVNRKRINVRGCNSDNQWAQKTGSGWNRLDPKKFDYFVCVAFGSDLNKVRYFIFSREDVAKFPNVVWNNTPKLKNIMLTQGNDELDLIVESSENRWNKIA